MRLRINEFSLTHVFRLSLFPLARARSSPSSMSSQAVAHNYRRGRWTEAGARRHGENARSCYAPMKLFPLDLVLRPLFKIISDFVLM